MPSYRAFNCRQQSVGSYRLDQEIFRTGFDHPHGGLDTPSVACAAFS
jgi:hypothetical protein